MAKTLETVHFRLRPDTDEQKFLEQNRRVEQNFVSQQPGFISRETAKTEDGEWIVVLHWERPEDAQASMDKFLEAGETKDFTALLDLDSFRMVRYSGV